PMVEKCERSHSQSRSRWIEASDHLYISAFAQAVAEFTFFHSVASRRPTLRDYQIAVIRNVTLPSARYSMLAVPADSRQGAPLLSLLPQPPTINLLPISSLLPTFSLRTKRSLTIATFVAPRRSASVKLRPASSGMDSVAKNFGVTSFLRIRRSASGLSS